MLGSTLMATPPYQEEGIILLENSFDPKKVSPTIDYLSPDISYRSNDWSISKSAA